MKTLILLDLASHTLSLFADAIARSFPFPSSVQVIPAADVSASEWDWAECVILGYAYSSAGSGGALRTFLKSLPKSSLSGKGLAIFQVQSRQDAPISAASGFGLARELRKKGMRLVAPPTIFFRTGDDGSEMEGELLRSAFWIRSLVKQWITVTPKESN